MTRKIRIETNDREHANEVITCEAHVLAAVNTQPRTAHFSRIPRDAGPQKRTITLTRADGGPIAPKIKSTRGENLTADLREVEPGQKYELDITIAPPWPNGTMRGNIILETGVEQAPTEGIIVYANVAPRLQAQPRRFTIPADLETEREFRTRLIWSGDKPGNVKEVVATDPDLKAHLEEKDGITSVVLEVPAGYAPVRRAGNAVVVKTDDPTARNFRIPMYVMRSRPQRRPTPARPPTAKPGNLGNRPVLKQIPTAGNKPTGKTEAKKMTPEEKKRLEQEQAAKAKEAKKTPQRHSTGVEAGS